MRTAHSLTVSHSICHAHPRQACPPSYMPLMSCMPPATHTPLPHMPPTMHAPLPCTPPVTHAPPATHALPRHAHLPLWTGKRKQTRLNKRYAETFQNILY